MAKPNGWEKADTIGKLAAGVLIPVVLAFISWRFNASLEERAATHKTVELAVTILQSSKTDETAGLHEWALGVLQETTKSASHSLPSPAVQELRDTRLPSDNIRTGAISYIGKGFRPEEFRNYVATLDFTAWRPQFVVLHNTSEPRLSQWHALPSETRMKNLASYYSDLGWSAGSHLFVADDLIWVFTPLTRSGVHTPSWNAISWGVTMVGEYGEEPFSPAVRENTVQAIAILDAAIGIDASTLRFHKEDPKTTHKECPGKNVDKDDLISAIQAAINSHSPKR